MVVILSDEHLSGPDKEKVHERLNTWIGEVIGERLKPLVELAKAEDVTGLARGIAFRMKENVGIVRREAIADEIRSLDQPARGQLRKYGVRFGAFNIFFPTMLKPASVELALALWSMHRDAGEAAAAPLPDPPRPGLTSIPAVAGAPEGFYRVLGFHPCGPRAVRVDMLERLADQIRPMIAWRAKAGDEGKTPPKGSTGDGGFIVTPDMMSILGCSADELGNVLRALGFRMDRKVAPDSPAPVPAGGPTDANVAGAAVGDAVSEPSAEAAQSADAAVVEAVTVEPVDALRAEATTDVAAAALSPSPETVETAGEPKYIEIWRPRRRHSQNDGAGERRELKRSRPPPKGAGGRTSARSKSTGRRRCRRCGRDIGGFSWRIGCDRREWRARQGRGSGGEQLREREWPRQGTRWRGRTRSQPPS